MFVRFFFLDMVLAVDCSYWHPARQVRVIRCRRVWIDGVTLEPLGPEAALSGQLAWFAIGSNPEVYEMGGNPRAAAAAAGTPARKSKLARIKK